MNTELTIDDTRLLAIPEGSEVAVRAFKDGRYLGNCMIYTPEDALHGRASAGRGFPSVYKEQATKLALMCWLQNK